ncbi:MAG: hypothetical protein ABSG90_11820 [Dehalococcoidia bacterium]|jgi:hypothetical protein
MQILIGDTSEKRIKRICQETGMGRMVAQNWPDLYEGEPWGFDNGAWGFKDLPGGFDEKTFVNRLQKAVGKYKRPYLAVCPDIVAGGMKSLEFSMKWFYQLPEWPWYLAVQDGMEVVAVMEVIDQFAGIFLGGTDEYKRYAGYWCQLAHHCGKKFHYGRAGTLNKLAHAIMVKADSLDSAFPLWTKNRLFSFIQAISQQHFDLTIFAPHPERGQGSLVQI